MYTDLPLHNKNEDGLGRYLFAEEIANGLIQSFGDNHESLVLGINGPWGSGKSTLINFIVKEIERHSIERNEPIIILSFNPWMFSGQRELQNVFLNELFLKFESQKDKLKKASKKLADFLGHLNWLKYAHSGAGEAVKDAQEFLGGLTKEKDLPELKADVDKVLIKSGVKLYISIDDIDRLTPSEITDIFQLVKLNGNFANTVFLLAYDQSVVTKALKKQFGINGKKYIEKIVQVDYTIPEISRSDIERIFVDSIDKVFSHPAIKDAITRNFKNLKSESFVKLFTSIRDVYRFNNGLKLRLPSIYQELNLRDFFIIEGLRIFRPEAYSFILNSKDDLTHIDKSRLINPSQSPNSTNESKSQFIDKQDFDDLTKILTKQLFELKDSGFIGTVFSEDLIREKRIANPNYFDRYFNLRLTDFDIQENVFIEFIEKAQVERKLEILKNIQGRNKLFHFLNWIEIKNRNVSPANIESIIYSAFKFSDTVKYHREEFHFDSDFMTLQRFCSRTLDRLKTIEERRNLIEKHITDSEKNLSFSSCYTISQILYARKLHKEGKLYSNYMWYDLFNEKSESDLNMKVSYGRFIRKPLSKFLLSIRKTTPF